MRRWAGWTGGGLIAIVSVTIVIARIANACDWGESSPLADLNLAVIEGARWSAAIGEYDDLSRDWGRLAGREPPQTWRLSQIAGDQQDVAEVMVERLERLQRHPGTREGEGERYLAAAIRYWQALATLADRYHLYALASNDVSRWGVERAEDARAAAYRDWLRAQCDLAREAGLAKLRAEACR